MAFSKSNDALDVPDDTKQLLERAREVVLESRSMRAEFAKRRRAWQQSVRQNSKWSNRLLHPVRETVSLKPPASDHAEDAVVSAVTRLRSMYSRLQVGLMTGESLSALEEVAREAALLGLSVEVAIGDRRLKTSPPLAALLRPEPSWRM
jgi:hypothetical protein